MFINILHYFLFVYLVKVLKLDIILFMLYFCKSCVNLRFIFFTSTQNVLFLHYLPYIPAYDATLRDLNFNLILGGLTMHEMKTLLTKLRRRHTISCCKSRQTVPDSRLYTECCKRIEKGHYFLQTLLPYSG